MSLSHIHTSLSLSLPRSHSHIRKSLSEALSLPLAHSVSLRYYKSAPCVSHTNTHLFLSLPRRSRSHIHTSLSLAAAHFLSQSEILRVHHRFLSHTYISLSRCHALFHTYTHFSLAAARSLLHIYTFLPIAAVRSHSVCKTESLFLSRARSLSKTLIDRLGTLKVVCVPLSVIVVFVLGGETQRNHWTKRIVGTRHNMRWGFAVEIAKKILMGGVFNGM